MNKYYSDYHVHSHHSGDSSESVINIINRALKLNMQSICFTDHMDYDFPDISPDLNFDLNIPEYTREIEQYRKEYLDKIRINIGIELGMQPHISEENTRIISSYPFDFVIASTHVVNGDDPYYGDFWEKNTIKQCIERYFNDILTCIRSFTNFDVYGHLDYIIRYIPDKSFSFLYKDYSDIIDEILKFLISNNKGLEANTGGYKYGLGSSNPGLDILKRYRDLGGEIVTIGSDAHSAEYIGHSFNEVGMLLREAGFNHYNTFEKRNIIIHEL